jgi:hypothetical protein
MSFVRLPDEFFDVERPAFAGVERPDALVDLGSKLTELLDMRKQPAADLLLIGVGQARYFGDSSFKRFDHHSSISQCRCQASRF